MSSIEISTRKAPNHNSHNEAMTQEQIMQTKFGTDEIQFKPSRSIKKNNQVIGYVFDLYIDARAAQKRLTLADPNWSITHTIVSDHILPKEKRAVSVRAALTVNNTTRTDVGEDIGSLGDDKIVKSAFSDATKRAAVNFGCAAYLYENGKDDFVLWKEDLEPNKKKGGWTGTPTSKGLSKLKKQYEKDYGDLYEWQKNIIKNAKNSKGMSDKEFASFANTIIKKKYPTNHPKPVNAWNIGAVLKEIEEYTPPSNNKE